MRWTLIYKLFLCLFILFYSHTSSADNALLLSHYQMKEEGNQLSIMFQFNDEVTYHCLLLKNPDRFVVDLKNVQLKAKLNNCNNLFIKKIRSADHGHDYLRLVFDLKQPVNYSTFFSTEKHALTITLNTTSCSKSITCNSEKIPVPLDIIEKSIEAPREDIQPTKVVKRLSLPESASDLQEINKGKNIVIVIDPGHGGKDPGAAGPNGTVEKDVVLKISKQLQAMLNEEPGFCAVLTRTTDYYIPLRKRLAIARKNHADMFIAIHADAYHHSHATGASVYALSQRGATSEAAKWLAEKENESELGGLSDELADKDALLRSVLIDLSQTHTIESSLQIGDKVLCHLGKLCPLHHPKVEQAAFVVLKSPDIPSILVETGFLSNPLEEEKLVTPSYQHQTACAIKEGIKQYFSINSPNGTWFSDRRQSKTLASNEELKKIYQHKHSKRSP